jgi:hypothetical protein
MAPFSGLPVKKSTTFPMEYAKISTGMNRTKINSKRIEILKRILLEVKGHRCHKVNPLNLLEK